MGMSLSSLQLDAFLEVARHGSFSRAAETLNITQSALSQRILNLESELELTLFIRESNGIRLTDEGSDVLRYCQSRESLETELLSGLHSRNTKALAGRYAVGAFSTIMRPAVMKSLSPLARANANARFDFYTREVRELPKLLDTAQVDLIVTSTAIDRPDLESTVLGFEENVLVRPSKGNWPEDVYLDHDPEDMTTMDFFKLQKEKPKKFRRAYLDEVYAIIDGVSEGYGQAVIPTYFADNKGLEVVRGMKSLKLPVFAIRHKQAFYTRLQTAAFDSVCEGVRRFLKNQSE
jgi:DNA-binding transcriptional LysR family regulator